jgi:hypothetical protein
MKWHGCLRIRPALRRVAPATRAGRRLMRICGLGPACLMTPSQTNPRQQIRISRTGRRSSQCSLLAITVMNMLEIRRNLGKNPPRRWLRGSASQPLAPRDRGCREFGACGICRFLWEYLPGGSTWAPAHKSTRWAWEPRVSLARSGARSHSRLYDPNRPHRLEIQ